MEGLDLLKKEWNKESNFPKITESEIYKMIHKKSSSIVKWIFIISILLFPLLFVYGTPGLTENWIPLATLALFTTCVGHTLFLMSFRHFTITTASIMSSMQPVFGIIIALIFLKEYPSFITLVGGALILLAVIIEGVVSYKTTNRHSKQDRVEEERQ